MAEVRVALEDGLTAVLVFLVDEGPARMDTVVHGVADSMAEPWWGVGAALRLLGEMGWAEHGLDGWVATFAGRRAVERARTLLEGGDGS